MRTDFGTLPELPWTCLPTIPRRSLLRAELLSWHEVPLSATSFRALSPHRRSRELAVTLFARIVTPAHLPFLGGAVLLAAFLAVPRSRRVLELTGLIALGLTQGA